MARLTWLEFGLLDTSNRTAGVSHPSFDTAAFSPDPAFCPAHRPSCHFSRPISPFALLFCRTNRPLIPAYKVFFSDYRVFYGIYCLFLATYIAFYAGYRLLFGRYQPFYPADTPFYGTDTLLNRTKYAV